jgi:Uma2 family endonuclease
MTRTMTRPLPKPAEVSLEDVQHFVLEGASWELYERLLKDIGNRPIRVTYDRGRMEIMSPLPEHERPIAWIGRLIEALSLELEIPLASFGSTTFRRRDKAKGLEPDRCYYFKREAQMRGRKRLNMRKDPPPELVVEIDITSRSVPREPIYADLGVPEIWRYDGRRLQCLHLSGGEYHVRKHSLAFPFLEPAQLQQFIDRFWDEEENSVLRAFLGWVRKNGWRPGMVGVDKR